MPERCPERELLLSQWTDCSSRVKKLLDEQLAAAKTSAQSFAGFEEQIRLARAAEIEARGRRIQKARTIPAAHAKTPSSALSVRSWEMRRAGPAKYRPDRQFLVTLHQSRETAQRHLKGSERF